MATSSNKRLLRKRLSIKAQVQSVIEGLPNNPTFKPSHEWVTKLVKNLYAAHLKSVASMKKKLDEMENVLVQNRLALDRILHLQVTDDLRRNTESLERAMAWALESLGELNDKKDGGNKTGESEW